MPSQFPSSRLALWLAVAAAWPLQGLAAAGLVQFVAGDVQLRRGSAQAPVAKGAEVESGDVVVTGAAGRAQIRFSDGGLVALYPDSQFTVTRYADAGNAAEDHFAVDLLRGGMRAITGLIGKRDPRNYRVTTPTAVVGIRGSAFLIAFNADGELVVSGEQDEIEVCTEAGCVGVKAGESVRVVASNQLPLYTHTRAVLPLPPPPVPFAVGEELNSSGRLAPTPVAPVPPPVTTTPTPPAPGVPLPPPPPPPTTTAPPPDPSIPTPPPPPTTGTPTQPPTTRPPVIGAPPTTPPTTAPTTPAPPATRPPIFVLPPIVRPIIVLPPIAVPPPPPVIR
ncbi:iron dicitrate transport regulator FecR [Acidovorax sp. Leaf76]|uniref:FecR family protein n=1 Tax=unclassified Acidovorax TaxID=2684926 RepID=UPI0007009038|nr:MULTISPECIES: FecR family protein [unclassified Acidovorax]KQO14372.1 iron dicitrate transport regulator FecR [Acidovorax sp. Leaf76]KQO37045.1 iron dicitrate transport regulator FecR [Acidovorax sp. Leaf84]KQS29281.1 iron dicitrate transport regulator FecR [Acidovorax sp. Leaf191]